MTKFKFIAFILAALFSLAGCGRSPSEPEMHPGLADYIPDSQDLNVIIVSFDALRADALGVYGSTSGASPNLDALTKKALVFDNAYSAAQATPTSFASIFTGKLPFRVFRGWNLLAGMTIASLFQAHGYRTGAVMNNSQITAARGFGAGFDHYNVVHLEDEAVLEVGKDWIVQNHDRPFFFWLHFISPHTPYVAREMAAQFYTPGYTGRFERTAGSRPKVNSDADLARLIELYTGEVFYADHLFGELWAQLDDLGLVENTIVIVTADHGEAHQEHGRMGHSQVYEPVIRVPLIFYHPQQKPRGVRTDVPYLNTDLLPTLASAFGWEVLHAIDGMNLREPTFVNRPLISTAMTNKKYRSMSVRVANHKLVMDCPPEEYVEELFDLVEDPAEEINLILDRPEIASKLFDLAMAVSGGSDPCVIIRQAQAGKNIAEDLDEELIEDLRSLGYIQ